MAKRDVNFFIKIASDEDFETFLKQEALLVLDIYLGSFGPCAMSLHGTLEKAKVGIPDSSKIQLAVCNSNEIEKLKRFRTKCIPTIMFCSHEKVVDIVYGANIPLVKETINKQLVLEDVGSSLMLRSYYDFDEPLPFELVQIAKERAAAEEVARILKDKKEAVKREMLTEIIELMKENASDTGVTVFMPHVADSALKKVAEVARRFGLLNRARQMVRITPELLEILNFELENPLDAEVVSYLYGKDVLVALWAVPPSSSSTTESTLNDFVRKVTETRTILVEDDYTHKETEVEINVLESLAIFPDNTSRQSGIRVSVKSRSSGKSSQLSSTDTVKTVKFQLYDDDFGDLQPKLIIWPAWTPANQAGNAIFMFHFFRNAFDKFLPPVKEPEPPHLCMIFQSSKHVDVFEMSKNFPKDILAFGFFTGSNLNDMKLVCKTVAKYDEQQKKPEKLVLKVAEVTCNSSLALAMLYPSYVSFNTTKGEEECAKVFNEAFYAPEEEVKKN